MQLGMIGLGRMGGNMVRRLLRAGHSAVAFDFSADKVRELTGEGATGASSMEDLVQKLAAPRAVWIMVPAGDATEKTVEALAALLSPGDAIIDGGACGLETVSSLGSGAGISVKLIEAMVT